MQLNGDTAGEYMSRKYTLTLIALIVLSYKLIAVSDAGWSAALITGIVGIVSSYSYFNVKETDAVKELKIKGLACPPAGGEKPPVEPEAGN